MEVRMSAGMEGRRSAQREGDRVWSRYGRVGSILSREGSKVSR